MLIQHLLTVLMGQTQYLLVLQLLLVAAVAEARQIVLTIKHQNLAGLVVAQQEMFHKLLKLAGLELMDKVMPAARDSITVALTSPEEGAVAEPLLAVQALKP